MNNKFLRYCFVESRCQYKIFAILVLIAVMFGQFWYSGVQAKRLETLTTEKALVERISEIESRLNKWARVEAFQKEEDIILANVNPTKISGIAMQKGAPSVLIDGTVYSEGSSFGDYVIVKITKDIITLVNKKTNAMKNLYVFE